MNLTITINGDVHINCSCENDGPIDEAWLLCQLNKLKEKAMALKTQAELDALVEATNTGINEANAAATAEASQVQSVIDDLQEMIDNGVTDVSGLEAAVAALSGVKTNVENIYVAPIVTDPTVASLSASPTSGEAPLSVSFTTGGDGTKSLDFGDGSEPSTEDNPSHVYEAEGTFEAVLTVTNASGTTSTANATVTVSAPPA